MRAGTSTTSAKDRGFRNVVAFDATASGWLKGPYGLVTPWSAQRAFLSALGFFHADLRSTRAIVGDYCTHTSSRSPRVWSTYSNTRPV